MEHQLSCQNTCLLEGGFKSCISPSLLEERLIGAVLLEEVEQKQQAIFHHDAPVARPFLHDDSQEEVKGVLEGHNLLDVGVTLGETCQ